jgi:hypothetical protein
MRSTYTPGSYSISSSTLRRVTSFFQAGARRFPVSLNHSQESGVGSADTASGSESTTGTIAGGSPRKRAARSWSMAARFGPRKSWRTSRWMLRKPLTSGTWQATHLIRWSIAPRTSTWPPL